MNLKNKIKAWNKRNRLNKALFKLQKASNKLSEARDLRKMVEKNPNIDIFNYPYYKLKYKIKKRFKKKKR